MRCENCGQISCVCDQTTTKKEVWAIGTCEHLGCGVRIRYVPGVHADVKLCTWCREGMAYYCRTCQQERKEVSV